MFFRLGYVLHLGPSFFTGFTCPGQYLCVGGMGCGGLVIYNKGVVSAASTGIVTVVGTAPSSFFDNDHGASRGAILRTTRGTVTTNTSVLSVNNCSAHPNKSRISRARRVTEIRVTLGTVHNGCPSFPVSMSAFHDGITHVTMRGCGTGVVGSMSKFRCSGGVLRAVMRLRIPCVLVRGTSAPVRDVKRRVLARVLRCFTEGVVRLHSTKFSGRVVVSPKFKFTGSVPRGCALLHRLRLFRGFGTPVLIKVSHGHVVRRTVGVATSSTLGNAATLGYFTLRQKTGVLEIRSMHRTYRTVGLRGLLCGGPL